MIYLKPTNGLCNRMRTIDSAITLCKKHKTNLTILWANEHDLNCSFDKIFSFPENLNFELKIVECPPGFPEYYIKKMRQVELDNSFSSLIQSFKICLKKLLLNKTHRKILRAIQNIIIPNIILNKDLHNIYKIGKYEHLSGDEMDRIFFTKNKPFIKPLFENPSNFSYIESCFRLYPKENNYSYFVPTLSLMKKIDETVKKFDKTVGLHIRRTDHNPSILNSTNKKFIAIITEKLKNEPDTSFFLATDDYDTKEEIMIKFGDKIITNNTSSFDRSNETALMEAVIDLFCLSHTKQIYGSHQSTFSQTASDIGQIREITVR